MSVTALRSRRPTLSPSLLLGIGVGFGSWPPPMAQGLVTSGDGATWPCRATQSPSQCAPPLDSGAFVFLLGAAGLCPNASPGWVRGWTKGWMGGGWVEGWKDGQKHGWVDKRMDGWRDGWKKGWREGGRDGQKDGWMDGWTDRHMGGWMAASRGVLHGWPLRWGATQWAPSRQGHHNAPESGTSGMSPTRSPPHTHTPSRTLPSPPAPEAAAAPKRH